MPLASMEWTRLNPPVNPTVGLALGSMAFDEAKGRCVLFGKLSSSHETWSFDGSTWTRHMHAAVFPERRDYDLAYDAKRQRMLMLVTRGNYDSASPRRMAATQGSACADALADGRRWRTASAYCTSVSTAGLLAM